MEYGKSVDMKYFKLFISIFLSLSVFIACDKNKDDQFAIPYQPKFDITDKSQHISISSFNVVVDVTRPLKPFQHQIFSLQFLMDKKVVFVQKVEIAFNMKMDMGKLVFLPKHINGTYKMDVILPKCITGDNRWYGKLTFVYADKSYQTIFIFDME